MIISATEALSSSDSSDRYKSSNLEAMPAILKSSHSEEFILSSKRSALSASSADCFNVSLGAGPLWWSWCPWGREGRTTTTKAYIQNRSSTMGRCAAWPHALCSTATNYAPWGVARGVRCTAGGRRGTAEMPTRRCGIRKGQTWSCHTDPHFHVPWLRNPVPNVAHRATISRSTQCVHVVPHWVIDPQRSLGPFTPV